MGSPVLAYFANLSISATRIEKKIVFFINFQNVHFLFAIFILFLISSKRRLLFITFFGLLSLVFLERSTNGGGGGVGGMKILEVTSSKVLVSL